jgi:hypothetical protein
MRIMRLIKILILLILHELLSELEGKEKSGVRD